MATKKQPEMMSLDEFKTSGLLQEVNRQLLHPLGLALALSTTEGGKVTHILGILDFRNEPAGLVFNNITADHLARMLNVKNEFERRGQIRMEQLGFIVQPVETVNHPASETVTISTE